MLDDAKLALLRQLMEAIAELVAGRGDPLKLAPELEQMIHVLADVRVAKRMWSAVHAMVDPHTARVMASPSQTDQLAELSLKGVPEQALVALIANRDESVDPVDDLVKRDSFQRACVELARSRGNIACGRIGDHGVAFLVPQASDARLKSRFSEIAEHASRLAHQVQFKLHVGTSSGARGASLPVSYQAALAAAEEALSRGADMVHARRGMRPPADPLGELRRGLGTIPPDRPLELSTRFERYLQAVAVHAGDRLEAARLHVKTGFEHLAEPLVLRALLEAEAFRERAFNADQAADAASTINDLFVVYRRAVSDMETMLARPADARRESSLQRAIVFIHEHFGRLRFASPTWRAPADSLRTTSRACSNSASASPSSTTCNACAPNEPSSSSRERRSTSYHRTALRLRQHVLLSSGLPPDHRRNATPPSTSSFARARATTRPREGEREALVTLWTAVNVCPSPTTSSRHPSRRAPPMRSTTPRRVPPRPRFGSATPKREPNPPRR